MQRTNNLLGRLFMICAILLSMGWSVNGEPGVNNPGGQVRGGRRGVVMAHVCSWDLQAPGGRGVGRDFSWTYEVLDLTMQVHGH